MAQQSHAPRPSFHRGCPLALGCLILKQWHYATGANPYMRRSRWPGNSRTYADCCPCRSRPADKKELPPRTCGGRTMPKYAVQRPTLTCQRRHLIKLSATLGSRGRRMATPANSLCAANTWRSCCRGTTWGARIYNLLAMLPLVGWLTGHRGLQIASARAACSRRRWRPPRRSPTLSPRRGRRGSSRGSPAARRRSTSW